MDGAIDLRHVLLLAPDAVLGTEQRRKLPSSAAMQQINDVSQIARHRALVRDEADVFARDGAGIIKEYFQSGPDDRQCSVFPSRSCSACGMRCRMACRFSRAPLSLPGKFTMSAVPRVAAIARDSGAIV